jgi:hypothetical protein
MSASEADSQHLPPQFGSAITVGRPHLSLPMEDRRRDGDHRLLGR